MARYRMAPPYELPHWPAAPRPREGEHHAIVIVGAGVSGLTLACDLAARGVRALLVDEDDTVGVRGASSRGICWSRKSLETFERLGVFERIAAKGVGWSIGNTFSGEHRVWSFNLQRDSVSRQPPFINLQQFYVEWYLVERLQALGVVELRWRHRLQSIDRHDGGVRIALGCPEGDYTLHADWLIDATGVASPIRRQLGLDAHYTEKTGDTWCITDVRFSKELPAERRTWIDAPFNQGRAVWQHPMADGVWRLDYQMGTAVDAEAASRPDVAGERLAAHLGEDSELEIVWIGPYQYRELLLERFVHGRVVFIGDAAHVVCPFGARGGNSGVADADNLGWRLAWLQRGWAGAEVLDGYDAERHAAAAENLRVTQRTARFLAPRSEAERTLRRAVVGLAREHAFARPLVNAGRMSVANDYPAHAGEPRGATCVQNLPLTLGDGRASSLMALLAASDSRALRLCFGEDAAPSAAAHERVLHVGRDLRDDDGRLAAHLQAGPGSSVRVRPDGYRSRP